jgi:hypothetical protein
MVENLLAKETYNVITGDDEDKQAGIGQMTRRLVTTGKDLILTDNSSDTWIDSI